MQVHKNWKGIVYNSYEECQITILNDNVEIKSNITGHFEDKAFVVSYQIKTNRNWETIFFKIESEINKKSNSLSFSSDSQGNWYQNGKLLFDFANCFDIDISLTPLTNTLPIKRVGLSVHEEMILDILYIDVLAETEIKVHQKYKRLSSKTYKFENVPNKFEAILTLDDQDFVVNYPNLFTSV